MDGARGIALASFALLASGATLRWWLLEKEKEKLMAKSSSKPSVEVSTLTTILKELHGPAQTVVTGLITRAQTSTSPTERKELMEDSSTIIKSGLEKEEEVICKRHGVTVQDVEDAYRYYSGRADADPETAAVVEAAAGPIKKTAGQFLLNKHTVLKLLQTIADVQCENMSKIVNAIAKHMTPNQGNIQTFMQAVQMKMQQVTSKVTETEYGVSMEQVVMRAQGYAQTDIKFRRTMTAIMAPVDQVTNQVLNSVVQG